MKLLIEHWAGAGKDVVDFPINNLLQDGNIGYSDCCQLWASILTKQPHMEHKIISFKVNSFKEDLERMAAKKMFFNKSKLNFCFINIPWVFGYTFDKPGSFVVSTASNGVWTYPTGLSKKIRDEGIKFSIYTYFPEKPNNPAFHVDTTWWGEGGLKRYKECIIKNREEQFKLVKYLLDNNNIDVMVVRWTSYDCFAHTLYKDTILRASEIAELKRCHDELIKTYSPEKWVLLSGFGMQPIDYSEMAKKRFDHNQDMVTKMSWGGHNNKVGFYVSNFINKNNLKYYELGKEIWEAVE